MHSPAAANDTTLPVEIRQASLTSRQFVALVRAGLDAAGHHDIPIERSWIDHDTPDYPFLLKVPVGAELVVPLEPHDACFRTADAKQAIEQIKHFVQALVTLRLAEKTLLQYVREVHAAAVEVVTEARAEGLDLMLTSVGFGQTSVWALTDSDWEEAACNVVANVEVRHTSSYLRPEITSVYVDEPADVAADLQHILAIERERRARLARLDELGADLIVDAITLDLLRTHDVDVVPTLREAWKRQHVSVTVQHGGREALISLVTSDGEVESSMMLADAFWNGEVVWLLGANVENGLDVLGKTLAGKVDHPALAGRKVVMVDSQPEIKGRPDAYHLDRTERFLFDADTGDLRPLPISMAA